MGKLLSNNPLCTGAYIDTENTCNCVEQENSNRSNNKDWGKKSVQQREDSKDHTRESNCLSNERAGGERILKKPIHQTNPHTHSQNPQQGFSWLGKNGRE
jgi:hypothetical protein